MARFLEGSLSRCLPRRGAGAIRRDVSLWDFDDSEDMANSRWVLRYQLRLDTGSRSDLYLICECSNLEGGARAI
jgi:hypothetical protein